MIKIIKGLVQPKKYLIKYIGLFLIVLCCSHTQIVDANENNLDDKVKVGFYECPPYYYLDDQGRPQGYYHDLMELFSKELQIDYEYVYTTVTNRLDQLENQEIDLVFGVGMTKNRRENFIFSKYYIDNIKSVVYTTRDIDYGDLSSLEGLTFGYVEHSLSYEILLYLLQEQEIEVKLKIADSLLELRDLLQASEVDFIISSAYDKQLDQYNTIYDFSLGPVYIATYKGNETLMNQINFYFEEHNEEKQSEIYKLHNSYFNEYKKTSDEYVIIISILVVIIFVYCAQQVVNRLEVKSNRKKILKQIEQNKFCLYYQPIINAHSQKIVGFESLLRLNEDGKIITPYYFLEYIEESNTMYEMTLWILQKMISDYPTIKEIGEGNDDSFYISMNVSFNELKHNQFISDVRKILANTEIQPQQICFEIVERHKMDKNKKAQLVINEFKKLGFKIAIDDFGVEYSNFDILDKIDYDLLKLDKTFIDEIESSFTRREIIKCLAKIAEYEGKSIVIEGVETQKQVELIRQNYQSLICIQGYFYSKPVSIEQLKQFKVK